jgi:hypothetical protein
LSQELRSGIEALFTSDFSLQWLDSDVAISEAQRLDLADISQGMLPKNQNKPRIEPRRVTAKGAPSD